MICTKRSFNSVEQMHLEKPFDGAFSPPPPSDQITAIGELATLPLVVLVSFMAQPRLLFAMAKDGLLPRLFSEVDSRGTLLKGSLVRKRSAFGLLPKRLR